MAKQIYENDVTPNVDQVVVDNDQIELSCSNVSVQYQLPDFEKGETLCCDVEKRKVGTFDAKVCLFVCLFVDWFLHVLCVHYFVVLVIYLLDICLLVCLFVCLLVNLLVSLFVFLFFFTCLFHFNHSFVLLN